MMRALRGLIRVKRALALLTMVGSSGRPSYPRASSLCSRHGPLRAPKKFEKTLRNAPCAPIRREGTGTLRANARFASPKPNYFRSREPELAPISWVHFLGPAAGLAAAGAGAPPDETLPFRSPE